LPARPARAGRIPYGLVVAGCVTVPVVDGAVAGRVVVGCVAGCVVVGCVAGCVVVGCVSGCVVVVCVAGCVVDCWVVAGGVIDAVGDCGDDDGTPVVGAAD
jgi:hypothetical protein